ncbi:MAG: hypothetical protein P4L35_07815 [Ignavibacteriaceae bacterium]|nr:hypothetical protein [Ignavibacteriaceae bacterium]
MNKTITAKWLNPMDGDNSKLGTLQEQIDELREFNQELIQFIKCFHHATNMSWDGDKQFDYSKILKHEKTSFTKYKDI